MAAEQEYTNGRLRLRPEQAEYLDNLLHNTWIDLSRERARTKQVMDGTLRSVLGEREDGALITHMNRELRLIKSIQDELRRTMEDMGL